MRHCSCWTAGGAVTIAQCVMSHRSSWCPLSGFSARLLPSVKRDVAFITRALISVEPSGKQHCLLRNYLGPLVTRTMKFVVFGENRFSCNKGAYQCRGQVIIHVLGNYVTRET